MATEQEQNQGKTYLTEMNKLQNNADLLREGSVDIDKLLPIVKESVEAYEFCKARIEAVRQAMGCYLGNAGDAPAQ